MRTDLIVVSNIVWSNDPESAWSSYEETRDLPEECECPARFNHELDDHETPYECDCPPTKQTSTPPRKMTWWEVLLGYNDRDNRFVIVARGYDRETQASAEATAWAKFAADHLKDSQLDG